MTKQEFVGKVAQKSGLSNRDAAEAVDAFLDSITDALQGGVSVLVEGETIREVSAKPIKAPNADVIDCGGRTLMPGLIDCHVHVMLSEVNIRYLEAIPLTMMTVRAASLMRAMIERQQGTRGRVAI